MYVCAELHWFGSSVIPAAFIIQVTLKYCLNYVISAFPKSVKCVKVLL